ncbi:hypothetical protein BSV1_0460 [Borreliella finlandensis]|uniref:Uncharacterized protein n=1 Tax=Borreliella finlandensis TaxID=498741 RepID=A0A826H1T6_9SPIR|nr:hypothetical protein BSV1_0460 [Borreliella finlandensis]
MLAIVRARESVITVAKVTLFNFFNSLESVSDIYIKEKVKHSQITMF